MQANAHLQFGTGNWKPLCIIYITELDRVAQWPWGLSLLKEQSEFYCPAFAERKHIKFTSG